MRKIDYKKLKQHIVKWIGEYVKGAGSTGVVVGLSGGIDSATTAALCVEAIGKERVLSFSLPCESMVQDYEDAKKVAKHLDINFNKFDLSSVFQEFMRIVAPNIKTDKLAGANAKARLRMLTIYYIAQSIGNYLVAGTGNRTEIAIGYFTKYGDL